MTFKDFLSGLIKKPVGNNLTNDENDVFAVKSILQDMGRYEESEPNGIITRDLDHAIKQYQSTRKN